MPQVIEPDVRQFGSFQDGLEVLVHQAVHIDWPPEFRNEDQVHGFWPFFGINNWMCRLEFHQLLQSRENPILQSDQSSTASSFRLAILPLAGRPFSQRPLYADSFALPVDVLPLEADAFAWAHPDCNRDSEQSSVHRGQCESQECLRLLYTEHPHFAPSDTRQLQSFSRHFQNHFPTQSLPERRIQDPVGTLDRPGRESPI